MACCFRTHASAFACLFLVAALLLAGGNARSDDKIFALQRRIQKTIAQVEPAIVSISVSRSGEYARLDPPKGDKRPGRLGGFDSERFEHQLKKMRLPTEFRRQKIKQLDLADNDCVAETQGSGVCLDRKGLILTNYHLIGGAAKIYVRLEGGAGSYADICAADPRSDLAVLQLLSPPNRLTPLQIGNVGQPRRGQFVISLCPSFAPGFRNENCCVSWGIISAVRRRSGIANLGRDAGSLHATLLQIDRLPATACSGGAVVDLKGRLIGLMTSLPAVGGLRKGPDFVVPLTPAVRRVVGVMQKGEDVEYGYLGVRIFVKKRRELGVVVLSVTPGSPADKIGLKAFDTIRSINGKPLAQAADFFREMSTLLAGTKVRLQIQPPEAELPRQVFAVLAKYHFPGEAIASKTKRPFFRGLRVDDASLVVQRKFDGARWKRIPQGVVITEVRPNSPAATKFLKPGEIISHINGRAVESPPDFYRAVQGRIGRVELTILNSGPNRSKAKVMLN